MKDKKVVLIAGAGAVVLLGVLGYTFVGSSGNDANPSTPHAVDLGESSAPSDIAADSPTRGAAENQLGAASSRLSGEVDVSEAENLQEEAATQKKKRKNRKRKRGYSSESESEEEEETKTQSGKKLRSQSKIPLGGG